MDLDFIAFGAVVCLLRSKLAIGANGAVAKAKGKP